MLQALSAKLSGRILKAAREQQHEIDAEEQEHERVQVWRKGGRWVEILHGTGKEQSLPDWKALALVHIGFST